MIRSLSWLFLAVSICLNAGASALLKLSMYRKGLVGAQLLAGSVGCYGLAFLSYALCLHTLPVSVAYPAITGGAILAIVLAGSLFLEEPLTMSKALGAALIISGVTLLVRNES